MGRVAHQKSAKQASGANATRATKTSKQRKNHKVVIESQTKDQEKSRAVLSFRAEPPPGYTFIPAGNPQLTSALKEFAKKGNHQIFAVTTTPHATRHELSREVHRIGFHFPTQVVAQVCNHYGIRLTSGGKLVEEKDDDKLFMKLYQKGQLALDEEVRDQVTINTEAKQIIKDLFPNIPDNDLFQIIKTAFQLGDGKVGTADEIPLVRRAQLSVVAHIRHCYTNYDKLLRQVPYSEARHQVENITLEKLIAWRGDGEDNQAMDDTLREVVVISDEEESDDEAEESHLLQNEHLRVRPLNGVQPQGNAVQSRPQSPIEINSDEEMARGYRYLPQVRSRYPVQDMQAVSVARQQSRYAVWDRLRQGYRTSTIPQPGRVIERIPLDENRPMPAQSSIVSREPLYTSEPYRAVEPMARIVRQPSPPVYVRAADGKLYERITTHPDQGIASAPQPRMYTPPAVDQRRQYVDSRPISPRTQQSRMHRRTESYDQNDGTILPSIEGPNGFYSTPAVHRNAFDEQLNKRQSDTHVLNSRQPPLIDLTNSAEQASKRRRLEATPPSPYIQRLPERNVDEFSSRDARLNPIDKPYAVEQRQLITLDSPSTPFGRAEYRTQPTIVYHEAMNDQEISSPRDRLVRPMQVTGIRDSYQPRPAHRVEYFDSTRARGYENMAGQQYGEPSRQIVSDYPVTVADNDRMLRGDAYLQSRETIDTSEPGVRYIRSEVYDPYDGRGSAQHYVQKLPPEHAPRGYAPLPAPRHVEPSRDLHPSHFPSGAESYQQPRMAPQFAGVRRYEDRGVTRHH